VVRDLLTPIYGWFSEGFATPDLKDAKALLDALAWMRIPMKTATDSGASRPPFLIEGGQVIRRSWRGTDGLIGVTTPSPESVSSIASALKYANYRSMSPRLGP
jgi:hypothetical protein